MNKSRQLARTKMDRARYRGPASRSHDRVRDQGVSEIRERSVASTDRRGVPNRAHPATGLGSNRQRKADQRSDRPASRITSRLPHQATEEHQTGRESAHSSTYRSNRAAIVGHGQRRAPNTQNAVRGVASTRPDPSAVTRRHQRRPRRFARRPRTTRVPHAGRAEETTRRGIPPRRGPLQGNSRGTRRPETRWND